MNNEAKKTLLLRYIGALALLAVTVVVLIGMYHQAQKDDAAKASELSSTQTVTEQTIK